jgi:hypothetical protein
MHPIFKLIFFVCIQATPCPKEPNREMLNDGANWTIISTDKVRRIPSLFNRVVDPDSFESGSSLFSQSGSGLDPVLDSDPDSVWIQIRIWFGSGSGLTKKAGTGSGSGQFINFLLG